MARETFGWIDVEKSDRLNEFRSSNDLPRLAFPKKIHNLPPLAMHYESPRSPTGKQWSDQSLISTDNINNYLAESDAFQRASYENIRKKWKQYDKNKTNELISSFDSHYNMNLRFRHDRKLQRSSEMKYGSGAQYYRFIGNENNPKNTDKPCRLHKRRTQEYEERYIREALKPPTMNKPRSQPYFLPKIRQSQSICDDELVQSPLVKSFVSIGQTSQKSVF